MNGKGIVIFLTAVSAIAGAGLWYTTNHSYYTEVTADSVILQGAAWPVADYRGIDAESSPLKRRACFVVDWDYVPTDTHRNDAEPLRAPYWFDCFDAETIARDIAAGRATVHLAARNEPFGFSSFVAQYPDGRAYLWRQLNACGQAQAGGGSVPEGCEEGGMADHPVPMKTPDGAHLSRPVVVTAEALQGEFPNGRTPPLWACRTVLMNHSAPAERG